MPKQPNSAQRSASAFEIVLIAAVFDVAVLCLEGIGLIDTNPYYILAPFWVITTMAAIFITIGE